MTEFWKIYHLYTIRESLTSQPCGSRSQFQQCISAIILVIEGTKLFLADMQPCLRLKFKLRELPMYKYTYFMCLLHVRRWCIGC